MGAVGVAGASDDTSSSVCRMGADGSDLASAADTDTASSPSSSIISTNGAPDVATDDEPPRRIPVNVVLLVELPLSLEDEDEERVDEATGPMCASPKLNSSNPP